jgi:hypothetical protein
MSYNINRKLLKVEKKEINNTQYIILSVISKYKNEQTKKITFKKSTCFYIKKNELLQFGDKKELIKKDNNSFVEIIYCNQKIYIKLTLLNYPNIYNEINGNLVELEINKIEITGNNIVEVVKDKKLRKKLGKQFISLIDYNHDKIYIGDDFCKNSFSFGKYKNDKSSYFGGIILHTDSNDKQYYSIHT